MKKILASLLIFSSIGLGVVAFGVGGSPRPNANADAFTRGPDVDNSSAIVVLRGAPISTNPSTKPAHGRKIDFNSYAVRSYRAQLNTLRNDFKRWLRANAPRARVTSEYDISLNAVSVQLNGTPLAAITAAPMVDRAEYNALYHPTLSESYKIINAMNAWTAAGGRSHAGAGIKIGDIDTGIDNNHPFFDPTGFSYPPGFPKCDAADSTSHHQDQDCKYVSPKVIVAKVFYNKAQQQGLDAQAIQDHGTHTAGIAAGVTGKTAVANSVEIDDMSGIAPGAYLGNYNVFPGLVDNARSEDILNAVEAAVEDGMDVLNLSLGGGYHGNNDLLAIGLDNAVDAGVVVAVAAGNSGPGQGTLESPGRARKIITVAASTNKHFVGQPFTYPAGGGTTIGAAVGDFPPLPTSSFGLFFNPAPNLTGCASIDPGASGKVVVVDRGGCTFSAKVRNAIAAGAIGVVVINNVAGDPTAMAKDGAGGDDLPAVMIGKNEGAALRAANPPNASAVATFQEFITPNQDILAGFSSQGPTNVDLAVKPDVTSVGVNVLSSITCVGTGLPCTTTGDGTDAPWAFFSGTSMATPHIAGSAAVLLQIHSDWLPAQVKSALANRADLVIKDAITGTHDVGPTAQGGGRENLSVAADGTTWVDPVSASFGQVTPGHPTSVTITVYNPTGSDQTFTVSTLKFTPSTFGGTVPLIYNAGTITPGDDRITVPTSVTVPAHGSTTLTVSVNAPLGTTVQGWINLDGAGDNDLHFAYYARVGRQ
jgi:subtilisin family serine protease